MSKPGEVTRLLLDWRRGARVPSTSSCHSSTTSCGGSRAVLRAGSGAITAAPPRRMLSSGSVALDAAIDCTLVDGTTAVTMDQRGLPRPIDGDEDGDARCDVGAFERDPPLFEDGFENGNTSA